MHELWMGSEASHVVFQKYQERFQFEKEAFFRTPSDELPTKDANFGVQSDRIGLYLLEKVGDRTVLKVHGSLVTKYARWQSWFPGEVTSYEAIRDALKIAQESGNTDLLMDMASGGGSVNGLDVTTRLMDKLRRGGMKIDGHTDTNAFSACYWLMASCRQITASPQSEQGSIGTMAVLRSYVNTEERDGVKFTVLKAGKFKAAGNPFKELSEEDLAYLQKNVEDANAFFLEHVAKNRNLSLQDTAKWAEGRTFYAKQALEVGLIDKLATLDDLIGGQTAVTESANRRYMMQISPEKLAQIASGADPKTVLTDAELTYYTEQLNKQASEEEGKDKPEGDEGKDKPKEGDDEGKDKPTVKADTDGGLAKEFAEQARAMGKLETKLEMAEERAGKLAEENQKLAKQLEDMVTMGQTAVTKLQTALNLPRQAESNPLKLLAQFNDLNVKMAETFKPGKHSAEVDPTPKPAVSGDFRHAAKQLPANKR